MRRLTADRSLFFSAAVIVMLAFPSCAVPPAPTPQPLSATFIFDSQPLVFEFTNEGLIKPPLDAYFGITATGLKFSCSNAHITGIEGRNIALDVKGKSLKVLNVDDNTLIRGPVETITLPNGSKSPHYGDIPLETIEGNTVSIWFTPDYLPGRYFIDLLIIV
jgi:hypothetical protein